MGQSRAVAPPPSVGAGGSLWLCPGRCRRLLLADRPPLIAHQAAKGQKGPPWGELGLN